MAMDGVLQEEEACITQVIAEENLMKTIAAARNSREAGEDLIRKMSYLFENNPPEKARSTCETVVSIISSICAEPENQEIRSINSTSRSSPIQKILQAKGGFDVMMALGFYQGPGVWTMPRDVDLKIIQTGEEHLCVLLGIPDQIVLRKLQLQEGGSVAADLLRKMMSSTALQNVAMLEEPAADEQREGDEIGDEEDHDEEDDDDQKTHDQKTHVEETAEEKALTQLFKRLDVDNGGSLSVHELKIALKEFNIDEDRESVIQLLEEVESHGDEGMGLQPFKESMMRLLSEPVVEEDMFEGMDEDQVTRIKLLLKMLFNGQLAGAWEKWKVHVDNQQLSRTGALENYKRVCQVLTISPSISSVFRRLLQSRVESRIDLSNRGLSTFALKAFICGMSGWAPDFVQIEKLSLVPKDYIHMHPEETFAARCDPCVNVFELRKHGACVPLTELNLSHNAGGSAFARDLKYLLMKTHGCLTHLNVSSNNIYEEGARFIAEAIAHSSGPPLVHLELAYNKMGDKGTALVVQALGNSERIRSLTYLDISGNDCEQESSQRLGAYLQDAECKINHLDIGWNLIRHESSIAIFEGLSSNNTVTYLNVSWNGIDQKACAVIGECLKTCVLTELDLNHCNINGDGARLIAPGLKKNKLLRKLILDCNNLKQTGARALVKASLASEAHVDENGVERVISMVDCNLQSTDSTTFNRSMLIHHVSVYTCSLVFTSRSNHSLPPACPLCLPPGRPPFLPCSLCLYVRLLACSILIDTHHQPFGHRSEPAGKYQLDLDDPSDRGTFVELLLIAFHGKGCFAPQPGTTHDFLPLVNCA